MGSSHLINNAKDAILEKHIQNGEIKIRLQNKEIIIEDNGIDIPEHIKDRLFEPYFTTKETGTGIGLYMSKAIIEKMDLQLFLYTDKKFIIKAKK